MDPVGTTRLSFLSQLRNPGRSGGWARFHKRYGELLFSYARRLGSSHEDAEDIVQEVELSLYKAVGGFQHFGRKGCFRAYLRASVMHAVSRRAGKQARQEAVLDPRTLDGMVTQASPEDAVWEREQYLHRVRWAMRLIAREFEDSTLEAFRTHVLADTSVADTAERLGISKDSVYQAKSRVLKRLRERIESLDLDAEV